MLQRLLRLPPEHLCREGSEQVFEVLGKRLTAEKRSPAQERRLSITAVPECGLTGYGRHGRQAIGGGRQQRRRVVDFPPGREGRCEPALRRLSTLLVTGITATSFSVAAGHAAPPKISDYLAKVRAPVAALVAAQITCFQGFDHADQKRLGSGGTGLVTSAGFLRRVTPVTQLAAEHKGLATAATRLGLACSTAARQTTAYKSAEAAAGCANPGDPGCDISTIIRDRRRVLVALARSWNAAHDLETQWIQEFTAQLRFHGMSVPLWIKTLQRQWNAQLAELQGLIESLS